MSLDSVLATFEAEAAELLVDMESQLLSLESGTADSDAIHAIFRAAHTIKGSGGLFGFDNLVAFTHHVESLIDEMRDGTRATTAELISLLLRCCDEMGGLVSEALGRKTRSQHDIIRTEGLVSELKAALGGVVRDPSQAHSNHPVTPSIENAHFVEDASLDSSTKENVWHVKVSFGQDVFRNALDPLSFIRYLGTLGVIEEIHTRLRDIPDFEQWDPESCYLDIELKVRGVLTQEQVEGAFGFVLDYCELSVTADPYTAPTLESEHAHPESQHHTAGVVSGVVSSPEAAPTASQTVLAKPAAPESSFLRVEAEKLDHLINLIGELVIAGASCNLISSELRSTEMIEATSAVTTLIESIRDSALNLRMVQIGGTFNRFQRVVRDLSRELGKAIDLKISGADTDLDKAVVEKITDPLTHLVRNSIDHGIESRETRIAAGKSPTGTLQLNAYHDSGNIVIEVADDGGGINVEKVRQKAIERGLISETTLLSDRDIRNLIFEPGFSTAESVTNVSGRGVGMDVVRRNIENLRGTIDIESALGVGTTIRIRLPLTLAIIDGFLVGVGGAAFVVPLGMVLECIELRQEDLDHSHGRDFVNLRGEVLPFIRLSQLFNRQRSSDRNETIVVVRYGSLSAGLVVDELLGDFQTVIKPLGRLFNKVKGISGSTILGNGNVALILDIPALIDLAISREQFETNMIPLTAPVNGNPINITYQ
jgi:two-component system, chemotaxis family, sensor kinase CheA